MGTLGAAATPLRQVSIFPPSRAAGLILASLALACGGSDTSGPVAFTIDPPSASLVVGQTIQLTAVGAPGAVTWSTSDEQIVLVIAETGFVTAAARGHAQVTAVSGSSFASAGIDVTIPPAIALSAPTVDFEIGQGEPDPPAASIQVTNAGDGALTGVSVGTIAYGAGQPTGWLTAQLAGSAAPYTLSLRATAVALSPGDYTATVPVLSAAATNSPQSLLVRFRILAPASIVLETNELVLATVPGGTISDTMAVSNGGDRPLGGLTALVAYPGGQLGGWLTATVTPDTAPARLVINASAAGLPLSTFEGFVTVRSTTPGIAQKSVHVIFTIGPGPAITLSQATAVFNAGFGVPAPPAQLIDVVNGGGGTLSDLAIGTISYGGGATGWLAAQLAATIAPTSLSLAVASATLATGTYTATVPITSSVASNSPVNVSVTLNVAPAPKLEISPSAVTFSSYAAATNDPGAQAISITNSGGGSIDGLAAAITYNGAASGWLSATWQAGTTAPATLLLQPATGALGPGTYTATVQVSSTTPGTVPADVQVTFVVSSFTQRISPIFITSYGAGTLSPCSGCHTVGSTDQDRYNWARARVTPGNPNTGILVCKITSGAIGSCAGSPMPLKSSEIAAIRAWIAAGAPFY